LSQILLPARPQILKNDFSIGICAADHATGLRELVATIRDEAYPEGLSLNSIIIVASALDDEAHALLNTLRSQPNNLVVIEEPTRRGKAEAINRIIDLTTGRFLVLVNSDAQPERGAVSKLLSTIAAGEGIGMVSASPTLGPSEGVVGAVLELMWQAHNECLLTLNKKGMINHCCDELVAVRLDAIDKLPPDTVNDGAFLAGAAYRNGYSICYCESAHIRIDLPHRLTDVLMQRRRILFGHLQIKNRVGETPRTVESMLVTNPVLSLSILVRTLVKSPKSILALPVAVVAEGISVAMAIVDNTTSRTKHVPWARFGSKS